MDINDDAVQTINTDVFNGAIYREVDGVIFQLQEYEDESEIDNSKIEVDKTSQLEFDIDLADELSNTTPNIVTNPLYGILGISTEKFEEKKSKAGVCHICKKKYANLTIHTSRMHGNDAKKYPCVTCDKVYHSRMGLLYHMEIHADDKPHKCSECDKAFHSKANVKFHVHNAHRNRASLCSFCGKCLYSAFSLTRHLRMHTGKRPFKCEICGMTFAYPNVLRDHKLIHSGEKPFHCEICNKDFRQQSSLTQHLKYVHNGVKNIQCSKCDMKFSRDSYLRQHIIRVHSDKPRRFGPCPTCGKYFSEAHTLRRHIKAHAVLTHCCEVCQRGFRSAVALRRHVEVYEGRKSFACGHCGKSFHTEKKAENHVLQQHSTPNVQVTDADDVKRVENEEEGELKIEVITEGADESETEESDCEDGQKPDIFNVEVLKDFAATTSQRDSSATRYTENANQIVVGVVDQSLIGKKEAIAMLGRLDKFSKDSASTTALATQKVEISNVVEDENVRFQDTLEESGTMFDLQDQPYSGDFSCPALEINESHGVENFTIQDRMDSVIAPVISCDENAVHADSGIQNFQMEDVPKPTDYILTTTTYNTQNRIAGNDTDSADIGGGSVPGTSNSFFNPLPPNTRRGRPVQICETCGKKTANMKSHKKAHCQKHDALVNCGTCNKPVPLTRLAYHTSTHGEKRFACSICKKTFLSRTSMKNHMRTHSEEKPFQCEICQKCFRVEQTLKKHIRIHTGERPYPCRICGLRFGHMKVRSDHEKIHTGEKPHVCDVCGKAFTQRSTLRSHWATHTTEKNFKCEICGGQFARKNDLRQHKKRHLERERFKCELCDKEYSERYSLLKHLSWHEMFPCRSCNRRFKTKEELEQHEDRFNGRQTISCGICGQKYHSKQSARRHVAQHTDNSEKKSLKCDMCEALFYSEQELKEHAAKFEGQKPFECSHCGKEFHTKKHAMTHMKAHAAENSMP